MNTEIVARLDEYPMLQSRIRNLEFQEERLSTINRHLSQAGPAEYADRVKGLEEKASELEGENRRLHNQVADLSFDSRTHQQEVNALRVQAAQAQDAAEKLRFELRVVREKLATEEGKSVSLANALNMFIARLAGTEAHKSGLLEKILDDITSGKTLKDLANGDREPEK